MFFPFKGKLINTDHIVMVKLLVETLPRGYILNGTTYGSGITPAVMRDQHGVAMEERWDMVGQYPISTTYDQVHRLSLEVTVGTETFRISNPEDVGWFARSFPNDKTGASVQIDLEKYAQRCVDLRNKDMQRDKDRSESRKAKNKR